VGKLSSFCLGEPTLVGAGDIGCGLPITRAFWSIASYVLPVVRGLKPTLSLRDCSKSDTRPPSDPVIEPLDFDCGFVQCRARQ
jgi:hypothetical protein